MLDVAAMSKTIETACAAQAQGSLRIAAAVAEINSDADRRLQAAAQLEVGANHLTGQVDILRQGTGAFRL
jgi:methyl-accepting chemotaxis protein